MRIFFASPRHSRVSWSCYYVRPGCTGCNVSGECIVPLSPPVTQLASSDVRRPSPESDHWSSAPQDVLVLCWYFIPHFTSSDFTMHKQSEFMMRSLVMHWPLHQNQAGHSYALQSWHSCGTLLDDFVPMNESELLVDSSFRVFPDNLTNHHWLYDSWIHCTKQYQDITPETPSNENETWIKVHLCFKSLEFLKVRMHLYHIWITNNSTAWKNLNLTISFFQSWCPSLLYWQWTEVALCQTMEHVTGDVSPPQMEHLKEVDWALVCMTGNSEMKWESFWLSFLVSSPHGKNWIEKALFLCSYIFCFE